MLNYQSAILGISIAFSGVSAPIFAATELGTANSIFDAAEVQYHQYFNDALGTLAFLPDWPFYRGPYPSGSYVGINTADDVYVLGGEFGDSPVYIDSVDGVLHLLGLPVENTESICSIDDIPDGISYQQQGDQITITTNGQCILLPDDSSNYNCQVPADTATGINVLSTVEIINSELDGIETSISGINLEDELNESYAETACEMNSSEEYSSLNITTDVCFDVTAQTQEFSTLPGVETTPPVTFAIESVTTLEVVADCFATGADTISDTQNENVWVRDPETGQYTQISGQ